ncbi:MAG: glycosyltransferase family 4 protein [Algoriphagus sp.]|uniref:glycosyltransferase family 4 protein n=1 Tax=Algoriphagus sp. TaxID=1872435 RepID=UPI001841DE69|nr:glycosyltransferase family 4 protein [Algoriphagus sp.]NVJ85994.1 glycosyltransferase family 4 protein [Algoriphagus sp.]
METVAEVLANEFYQLGHQVDVVTTASLGGNISEKDWPFVVHRNPRLWTYWNLAKKSDVILHNCVSLKQLFPDLLYKNKVFVIHHTWYRLPDRRLNLSARLKRFISGYLHNCYISKAIQQDLGHTGKLIPNPYNNTLFKIRQGVDRNRSLVFLGRLVSDKGCMVLLEALKLAKDRYSRFEPDLTVIGEGPEKPVLESFTNKYLPNQVRFVGKLHGEQLAHTLNQHHMMVVPSVWEEPFGVVALEGMACGCLVIGSEKGGLKDAIGSCGWTFPNGDAEALANLLVKVWSDRTDWEEKYIAVPGHLFIHQPDQIAKKYLDYFNTNV